MRRSLPGLAAFGLPVNPVPQPETYALLMAGLAALAYTRRRRR
jgi:PEP-CTERM motif